MENTVTSDIIEKVRKLLNLAAKATHQGEADAAAAKASALIAKHGIASALLTPKTEHADGCDSFRKEAERGYGVWGDAVRHVLKNSLACETVQHSYGAKVSGITFICREADRELALFAWEELPRLFSARLKSRRKEVDAALEAETQRLDALLATNRPDLSAENRRFHAKNRAGLSVRSFDKAAERGYLHGLAVGFCQAWNEARQREIDEAKANAETRDAAEAYGLAVVNTEANLKTALARIIPGCVSKASRARFDASHFHAGVSHGREIKLARGIACK